jgi:glycerol-3-phosphate O-acyltransferase
MKKLEELRMKKCDAKELAEFMWGIYFDPALLALFIQELEEATDEEFEECGNTFLDYLERELFFDPKHAENIARLFITETDRRQNAKASTDGVCEKPETPSSD